MDKSKQNEESFLEDVKDPNKEFVFSSPESVQMQSTPMMKPFQRRRVILSDSEWDEKSPLNLNFSKNQKISEIFDENSKNSNFSKNENGPKSKGEIFVEDSENEAFPAPPSNKSLNNSSNEIVYSSPEIIKTSPDVITLNNSPYKKAPGKFVDKHQSFQIVDEISLKKSGSSGNDDEDFLSLSNGSDDDIQEIENIHPIKPDIEFLRQRRLSNIRKRYPQSSNKLDSKNEIMIISPPTMSSEDGIKFEAQKEKRLFGGKMSEKRLEKVHFITGDVISSMHNSLSTVPEDVITESPKGLLVDLMRHQKMGLTWLLWRETQSPRGGILADDMGLGKTLSMISLILYKKNFRLENKEEAKIADEKMRRRECDDGTLIASHATLVIAPATLIYQWEDEIKKRVSPNKFSVHVFHGPKNKRENDPRRLARYDIVITTFQTVNSELSEKLKFNDYSDDDDFNNSDSINSPFMKKIRKDSRKKVLSKSIKSVLMGIFWERIILDEAHQIKNRNSLISKSCCRLNGLCRWCLTGTPIHNELWDLYSLIRFLRVRPFNEEKVWKEYIMTSSKTNADRLNTLVKGLLLRRRKDQQCTFTKKPLVDLKARSYEIVNLSLNESEKRCYEIMFSASKQKVKDLLANAENEFPVKRRNRKNPGEIAKNPFLGGCRDINTGDRFQAMSCVLVMLLRLRQACVHMALTRQAVDMDAFRDANGAETGTESELDEIEANLSQMSLDESQILKTLEEEKSPKMDIERIFQTNYASTKVKAVLEHIKPVIEANEKCVIVSQWTSMLDIIEYHIKLQNIKYTSITGSVPTKDRQARVDSFNQAKGGVHIMLLSLTAGGVGLNLIGGNHLILMDLHWNPALEQQACDRIYRMGQTKNVFIHKFLCEGTIEKRVKDLQDKKMQLSTSVLEGATSKNLTKLTVADLRYLFELDHRPLATTTTTIARPNMPINSIGAITRQQAGDTSSNPITLEPPPSFSGCSGAASNPTTTTTTTADTTTTAGTTTTTKTTAGTMSGSLGQFKIPILPLNVPRKE